jgi:DNA-binding NarL/FixJ family response regulator
VIYTAHGDPLTERELRAAGASAFVVKGDDSTDLVTAVKSAAAGHEGSGAAAVAEDHEWEGSDAIGHAER